MTLGNYQTKPNSNFGKFMDKINADAIEKDSKVTTKSSLRRVKFASFMDDINDANPPNRETQLGFTESPLGMIGSKDFGETKSGGIHRQLSSRSPGDRIEMSLQDTINQNRMRSSMMNTGQNNMIKSIDQNYMKMRRSQKDKVGPSKDVDDYFGKIENNITKRINLFMDIKHSKKVSKDISNDQHHDFRLSWNGITKTIFKQNPELNKLEISSQPVKVP